MNNLQYHFPELNVAKIIENMEMFYPELQLTEQDFKTPKAEFWQNIYCSIVCTCFSVSIEQLLQQRDGLENNDLFEMARYKFRLGRAMEMLMNACGVNDFSMKDILEPSRKRLIHVMSAFINYYHFRVTREDIYESILAKQKSRRDEIEELLHRKDILLQQVNNIKALRIEEQPAVQMVEATEMEKAEQLKALHTSTMKKKNQLSQQKVIVAQKNSQSARLKEKCASAKEEISCIEKMIVKSPEKMKSTMERMEQKMVQLKETKEERTQRLVELQTLLEKCTVVSAESGQVMKQFTIIQEEIAKLKNLKTETMKKEEEIFDARETQKENTQMEEAHHRRFTARQEKLAKCSMQHELKIKNLQENLSQVMSDCHTKNKMLKKEDAELEAIAAQRQDIALQEINEQQKHEGAMDMINNKLSEAEEQIEIYHQQIGERWEHFKNAVSQ